MKFTAENIKKTRKDYKIIYFYYILKARINIKKISKYGGDHIYIRIPFNHSDYFINRFSNYFFRRGFKMYKFDEDILNIYWD